MRYGYSEKIEIVLTARQTMFPFLRVVGNQKNRISLHSFQQRLRVNVVDYKEMLTADL